MSSMKDRIAQWESTDASLKSAPVDSVTTTTTTTKETSHLATSPAPVLASATEVVEEAPVIELDVKEAALVAEKIIHTETDLIQPVVLRDVMKTEVHQIEQPILEAKTLPVQHVQRTLPEQKFEANLYQKVEEMAVPQAIHTETETEVQRVLQQPIVQERIHHKVIEQIQPVIYREIVAPVEALVVQPIYEKVVEKAEVIHHVAAPLHSLSELEAQLQKNPNTIKHESHALPIVDPATHQPIGQAK